MQISGTVAVVTGGASGIGRASALALARLGADVVLADVHGPRLAAVRSEIAVLGRRVLAIRCDVSRDDDVIRLAEAALSQMGRVDILMNNAGVVLRGALEQISLTDWQWCFDINVLGIVRGIRAFLPQMIERRQGHIVNTASIAGLVALTGEGAPYVASKFAVVGLSESLALYCRPRGIGVSLLCPGSVDTNLNETARTIGMTPELAAAETALAATVHSVLMSPGQIAECVVEAIEANRFFVLPDSQQQSTLRERAVDMDTFLDSRLAQQERARR